MAAGTREQPARGDPGGLEKGKPYLAAWRRRVGLKHETVRSWYHVVAPSRPFCMLSFTRRGTTRASRRVLPKNIFFRLQGGAKLAR
jgi:hypothetical protein